MQKPAEMFDRDFEWAELVRFATYAGPEPTLGVVSGRRRQGKTYLLDALCSATGGFYFAATEATEAESLRQFGDALAWHTGQPAPHRFERWGDALRVLMSLSTPDGRPVTAVIDEFPYLVNSSPELPSLLQRALGPSGRRTGSPVRLLLCGSAMSFMGNLLSGIAPLRGRASLELVVPTLDYRLAARFWGISDPTLAVLVDSVVGGTPAYAREFSLGDAPGDLDDFDAWVLRTVLNPGRPLFREARSLLAEGTGLRDAALYHGVLSAIAGGNHTRGGIANYLARRSTDLGHSLAVLTDSGLVAQAGDPFHGRRTTYRIAEPILTFHHAVMRPRWSDLERPGHAGSVWVRARDTFHSQVVGPHFEQICRAWTRWYAAAATLGGERTRVESGTVPDRAGHITHEVDVVVLGHAISDGQGDGRQSLLALGEAKWNEVLGVGHLRRLERIRDLLRGREALAADRARLLLFGGAGFTDELRALAAGTETIQLVDLDRLYHGE